MKPAPLPLAGQFTSDPCSSNEVPSVSHSRPNIFRSLGDTDIRCHPLGFGCYRIAEGVVEHESSLREYLGRGGNLIDTSANYTDGRSESLVGRVLSGNGVSRAVLVTKAGYIQGQNMTLAQQQSFPEVVEYGEGIWHCIHPQFLETQIRASCRRLKRDRVDVFLLHNPEYFLSHHAHTHTPTSQDHQEFYRRIGQAFGFLEDQVREGRIGWYGISSNHYGLSSKDPTMTSIQRCLSEAEKIASGHSFRVVQLPLNLYESGGALELNNDGLSALEFCQREGLGVLINRPLNAFFKNQMFRLADYPGHGQGPGGSKDLKLLVSPLHRLERSLADRLKVPLCGGTEYGLAEMILQIAPQVRSASDWDWVVERYLAPALQKWMEDYRKDFEGNTFWEEWRESYFQTIRTVLEDLERYSLSRQQEVSDRIRSLLERCGYPHTQASLSQIAMSLLLNLKGVSSVLNGMRRVNYVQDALGVIGLPQVDSLSILQEFSRKVSANN